ncbi:WXG100 family type VII secretion target [Nocardioides sp. DS6]|uniref:WXG100 family type VII secretion target n=1 Tax=Nocardioides eburneus TaxID=3231482 RepID=A0ABV3T119_9ACTN
MSGAYGLSPESVKKAQGIVEDYKGRFNNEAAALGSEIDALKSGWQGQGADAFQALHTYWNDQQRTIVQILDNFKDGLGETNTRAANAEISAVDGVKRAEKALSNAHLNGRLGG